MEFSHYSVMLTETVDGLNIRPGKIYVDGTLGGAGHSSEILKRLDAGEDKSGMLIGIDQDEAALEAAKARLSEYINSPNHPQVRIVRDNFENVTRVLDSLGIDGIDGMVLDLGVSSYQLDNAERGFTYREDVKLDMRMDTRQETTAQNIVNEYSEAELYRIIRDYGEEQFAKNIAKHIVNYRTAKKEIETTFELVEIIKAAIPARMREKGGHPAKKTFQAIRIELNRELDVLEDSIDGIIDRLNPGGRLCIITFHSLEDRIVKSAFRTNENPCICPPEFPVCVCGRVSKGNVITRKPIVPSPEELEVNSRSKSAKLRIFEKKS